MHLAPPGFEFAVLTAHLLEVLPDDARIEVEIGQWVSQFGSGSVAWLVVQPLACETDRLLRAKGVAEVKQALAASLHLHARLDVVVGDRRATLDTDGKGGLTVSEMSVSGGAITCNGGTCPDADDALRCMLAGLRLA